MKTLVHPDHGYYIQVDQPTNAEYNHTFCGEQNLEGADCPNCHKPLLQMLRLDTSDPRLDLKSLNISSLPLLWCWTCKVAQDFPFQYQICSNTSIKILRHGVGGATTEFPYPDYPRSFPARPATLTPVPDHIEEAMARQMDGPWDDDYESKYESIADQVYDEWTKHQVGGYPLLLQGPEVHECLVCSQAMPIFAVLSNENGTPEGFCDGPDVQHVFHLCLKCRVVAAYHYVT